MKMRVGILHIQHMGYNFKAKSQAAFSCAYDLETLFPFILSGKRDAIYAAM